MRVMSVQSDGDRERLLKYCKFLIQLGDGDLPLDKKGAIRIPDKYLLPCNDPNGLFKWTYDDKPNPLSDKNTCSPDEYSIFDPSMRTSTTTVIKQSYVPRTLMWIR